MYTATQWMGGSNVPPATRNIVDTGHAVPRGRHSFIPIECHKINPRHTLITERMENGPATHRPQWSAQTDGVMHAVGTNTCYTSGRP